MSKTIDERVVSMQFDNKQFESNVKTSMSTLDKLKQSLNFNGMSKGLEEINASARKLDFSGISNGIDTVKTKFSYLQATIQHQINNIVDSAVSAGKRISSAFTIEPIKSGFEEYETQINAVQTILANTESKGSTLKDVNGALDELNHYADKTIYNFTEMTRNIGTFTAAGVDLDTSVSAIKGIANLAAVSGSNSQQASTAMYQLSQALAAGTVKLQDWNSVVNAGMGGQVFQDALKETARVHGIKIDDMIKKEGSFRETLQKGWLSSEILTETLSKFTGDLNEKQLKSMGYTDEQIKKIMKMGKTANDAATKVKTFTQLMDTLKEAAQSGWTQSWEILVGDFEEAKKLWTSASDYFSDAINKSAEARNNLLEGWAKGGGRKMAIEAITNAFKGLLGIIKPIKEAFREVFPRMTSKQLLEITKNIRDLTRHFKLSSTQTKNLKSTFKGLFSVVDIGVTFLKELASGIVRLIGSFTGLGDGVLGVTGSIGDWLSGVRDSIKETDVFGKSIDGMVKFLQNGIDKFKQFASFIAEKIQMPGFEEFLKLMQGIWNIIQKVGSKISEIGSSIGSVIAGAFRNGDINSALDIVNSGIFTGILLGLNKFIGGLTDAFSDVGGFLDKIKGILDGVKGSLEAWQQQLKAGTLLKIAGAIALLAGSLVVLSMIDPERLTNALGAITVLFGNLMGALAIFDKIDGSYSKVSKASTLMIAMSISILLLASAMKKIADLSWSDIGKGLTGLVGLTSILVAAAKIMSSENKTVVKGAGQMILMAAALKIMVSVLKGLSSLSWEGLGKGLTGVAGILLTFVGFQKLMSMIDSKKMISSSTSLLIMGAAMQIFASVCKKFESISWEGLGKAGAAIGGILALAAGFTLLSGYSSKLIKSSVALVIIGAAMEIFADVCKKFGALQWESLGKAGAAIGGILALAAGFTLLSGLSSGMLKSVVSLTIMAGAMEIFADVCQKFGSMDWESLGKAGAAIGGLLALAAGFTLLSGLSQGIIKSSASLLIMAAALRVFVPVMTTLGSMSWESIAKGLLTIAGAFAIIGVAGAVLAPVVPAILGLAGSLVLIGVATLTVGAGLMAISAGLTALATVTASAATAIVASLTIIITGIINLIPAIAQKIGEAIIVLCEVIAKGVPAIGEAIRAIIVTLVKVLVECVPMIVEGALVLVTKVLASLASHIQDIVGSIMQIIIGVINGIANNMPALIKAVVNLIGSLFKGVIEALNGINTDGLLKAIAGIGMLTGIMIALSTLAALVPSAMVGVLALGVLIAELSAVLAAVGGLAQIPGLKWLISEGGNLLQAIGTAIGQFIGGIVGGIAVGVTSTLPQVGTNLSNFMKNVTPFIEGAKAVTPESLSGVKSLVGVIMALTAANILDGIATFITGENSLTKFSNQIVPFGKAMADFSAAVSGNIDEGAVTAAANAGKLLAEMASVIPNEGGLVSLFAGDNKLEDFYPKLVPFGKAMAEFSSTIAGKIDEGAVTAAANAGKLLAEMSSEIPNHGGFFSLFTGDNKLEDFYPKLVPFGKAMADFSAAVAGKIDEGAVTAAANAGKAISEMSNTLPNNGGFFSLFTGDNKLEDFYKNIVPFGEAMADFSAEVAGNIDEGAVTAAANAGKAIAEMSKTLPNHGGFFSLFTGDNKLEDFCNNIVPFGKAMAEFSSTIAGKIDEGAVTAAANAGKALAEMQSALPKTGGFFSWFSGDESLEDFIEDLKGFGTGMAEFSDSVKNIKPEAVSAAASTGKVLVDMVKGLPEDTDVGTVLSKIQNNFPTNLENLGKGIASFSDAVSNKKINKENVEVAKSVLNTITGMLKKENSNIFSSDFKGEQFKTNLSFVGNGIAEFCKKFNDDNINTEKASEAANVIKNIIGGLSSNKITSFVNSKVNYADFGTKLSEMGKAISKFSKSLSDEEINAKAINKVTEILSNLPDTSKINTFASSKVDFKEFGNKLSSLGKAVTKFSKSMGDKKVDLSPVNNAMTTIGKLMDNLPDSKKILSFTNSEVNFGTFGNKLASMGKAIVKFSNVFVDKKVNLEPAKNAINVLKSLMNNLPDSKKIISFTNSEVNFGTLGNKLSSMGKAIVKFSNSVNNKKFNPEAGISAIKLLKKVMANLPNTEKINAFVSSKVNFGALGNKLSSMGKAMTKFSNSVSGKVNTSDVNSAIKACKSLVNLAKGMGNVDFGKMSSFSTGLKKLGNAQVDKFVSAFKNSGEKMNSAGAAMAKNLNKGIKNNLPAIQKSAKSVSNSAVNGFKSKQSDAAKAGEALVKKFASGIAKSESSVSKKGKALASKAISGVKDKYDDFKSAGKYLGKGLANGLEEKRQSLYDKGASLAKSANKGFTDNEEINSPSKVWYGFGGYMVKGLINALGKGEKDVYKSTAKVAKQSTKSLSGALNNVSDILNMDVDSQPTIRPVLDLSDISDGAGAINGMFDMQPSVGVMSDVNSVNSMMNRRQNGNAALLSAIKGLRKDFADSDSGVTVDVHLDYNAGSDANDIANDIATSLRRAIRRGV
jgi:tape measure domain-containing protein